MQARWTNLALFSTMIPLVTGCGAGSPVPTEGTVHLAVVAGAAHGGRPFHHGMTQEVTVVPVYAGDADGSGEALITINLGRREVCWELSVSGVALPATAAHIHRAPEGIRGGISVSLSPPGLSGTVAGCATVQDAGLLQEILVQPEEFYVNVHTAEYPAGAVRAQLGR